MLSSFALFLFPHGLFHVNVYRLGCRWKEMGNEAALSLVHTRTFFTHTSRNATQYNVFGGLGVVPLWGQMIPFP